VPVPHDSIVKISDTGGGAPEFNRAIIERCDRSIES
jgi:hypothetical protein